MSAPSLASLARIALGQWHERREVLGLVIDALVARRDSLT